MKKKSSKKHAQFKIPKLGKKHIPYAVVLLLVLYLIFAYNYFYYVQRASHIPWPNNQHVYQFGNSGAPNELYISLGDSLTYGFGTADFKDGYTYQVASSLAAGGENITLKDYSYPGFRTDDVIKQLDLVIADKPKIITLFIGVNDTHQLVETSNFQKNYAEILSRLTTETDAKIYAINVPLLGADTIQWFPYNYFFDYRTKQHNQTIKQLTSEYRVDYIDVYSPTAELFRDKGGHYSRDSFHPSAAGYDLLARIIENDINN